MGLSASSSPRLFCIQLFGCKRWDQAWAVGKLRKAVGQKLRTPDNLLMDQSIREVDPALI